MLLANKLGVLTCLWYTAFRSKLFCFPEIPFLSYKYQKYHESRGGTSTKPLELPAIYNAFVLPSLVKNCSKNNNN